MMLTSLLTILLIRAVINTSVFIANFSQSSIQDASSDSSLTTDHNLVLGWLCNALLLEHLNQLILVFVGLVCIEDISEWNVL